jgi:hypothetical protein
MIKQRCANSCDEAERYKFYITVREFKCMRTKILRSLSGSNRGSLKTSSLVFRLHHSTATTMRDHLWRFGRQLWRQLVYHESCGCDWPNNCVTEGIPRNGGDGLRACNGNYDSDLLNRTRCLSMQAINRWTVRVFRLRFILSLEYRRSSIDPGRGSMS